MKIGVTCYPTYGGSGAIATELGIAMAERGHEIHFISYDQPFRLTHFTRGIYFHEVEVTPYPLFEFPPYSMALAVEMHEVVRSRGLDLLHVHYAVPHATSAWVAREMLRAEGSDVKIVTTLHGTDITLVGQDASFRTITQFSIQRSDGLTAVSEHLRRRTLEAFDCAEREIRVIPNFVDPEVYDRDRYPCQREALAPPGSKVVMHISNFRALKRVGDVVRIFAAIASEIDATLVLVGDGPRRQEASAVAEELGVADRVVFLGKLESVAELLACADLFLLPSEEESFGLVALEAQASGVPVVGTEGSGLSEVVEDGVTGALHPVGDVEAMARSGLALLGEDRWAAASRAGRERAVDVFSSERIVPRYEAYYHEVLEAPSSAEASTA